jgi:hypothetical protein
MDRDAATTHFLNVDLHIYSRSNLQPLVDAFGENAIDLQNERVRGLYWAVLEENLSRRGSPTVDRAIRRLCQLIRARTPAQRRLWNKATRRDFNIGIQSDVEGNAFHIEAETVKAAAAVGARIVITVYGTRLLKPSS